MWGGLAARLPSPEEQIQAANGPLEMVLRKPTAPPPDAHVAGLLLDQIAHGAERFIEEGLRKPAADFPPAAEAAPFEEGVHAAKIAAIPGALGLSGLAAAWNAPFDMLYDDLRALTPEELAKLGAVLLSQGTALMVHPRQGGADGIEVMAGSEFVTGQRNGSSTIDSLVVPGVGSTSIAAASLARNVADTLGKPVAAIVPGYGAADLLADASGGWFVLGANNALLDTAARIGAKGLIEPADASEAAGGATVGGVRILNNYWPSPLGLLLNETSAAIVLQDLFSHQNNLKLLVGHSKGCLALAFALNALARRHTLKTSRELQIVMLGCVTYFSSRIENLRLHQYRGSLDVLGATNSRRDLPYTPLSGKTHSLNSWWPTSVSVADVLHRAKLV